MNLVWDESLQCGPGLEGLRQCAERRVQDQAVDVCFRIRTFRWSEIVQGGGQGRLDLFWYRRFRVVGEIRRILASDRGELCLDLEKSVVSVHDMFVSEQIRGNSGLT